MEHVELLEQVEEIVAIDGCEVCYARKVQEPLEPHQARHAAGQAPRCEGPGRGSLASREYTT